MSQQSLASKTITKRNVAQSSVIFSVVVAVITLGVIATVAYVDIKEDIDSVANEKSIPELIAEQKIKSEENRKQAELLSQSEELVVKLEKSVEGLNQLEQQVSEAKNKLNIINTTLQTDEKTSTVNKEAVIKTVQAVNASQSDFNQLNNSIIQPRLKSIFDQNHAAKLSAKQAINGGGEASFEISWLFKGRGSMSVEQQAMLEYLWKNQSAINQQAVINLQNKLNTKSL